MRTGLTGWNTVSESAGNVSVAGVCDGADTGTMPALALAWTATTARQTTAATPTTLHLPGFIRSSLMDMREPPQTRGGVFPGCSQRVPRGSPGLEPEIALGSPL